MTALASGDTIHQLIYATDTLLWNAYQSAIDGAHYAGQIVFPRTTKGTIRVSEQEAKQLLIKNLINSPFSYSVETPTSCTYSFSGMGNRSAATDLTLYNPDGTRFLNFEFKAHNVSLKRRNLKHITKDIQKLVLEDVHGFWFHTLKSTNSASITCLWQTIRKELKDVVRNTNGDLGSTQFTFHCCVLQEAFSVQTTFPLNDLSRDDEWLVSVEPPSFKMKGRKLMEMNEADGWTINRHVLKV